MGSVCMALTELFPVQLGIQAIPRQQLVVTAGLYEATVVEDKDLVGGEDGGEAVGDDEGSASVEGAAHGIIVYYKRRFSRRVRLPPDTRQSF